MKLSFYVPPSHVEAVKDAIFAVGAGCTKCYDHCCWQTLGKGQFRPLKGSNPFLGKINVVAQVEEYKVEVLCIASKLPAIVAALRQAHPYEEPAFDCCHLLTLDY